jgi:hypothetical protein
MRIGPSKYDIDPEISFRDRQRRVDHLRSGHAQGLAVGNRFRDADFLGLIMLLRIPGHLPGLVPEPFPIQEKSQGTIPETHLRVPGPTRPFPVRAVAHPCPGWPDTVGGHAEIPLPRPANQPPSTTEPLTTNDHYHP